MLDMRLRRIVKMVTDWKYDLQNGVISRSDDRSSDGSTNVTTTVEFVFDGVRF